MAASTAKKKKVKALPEKQIIKFDITEHTNIDWAKVEVSLTSHKRHKNSVLLFQHNGQFTIKTLSHTQTIAQQYEITKFVITDTQCVVFLHNKSRLGKHKETNSEQ